MIAIQSIFAYVILRSRLQKLNLMILIDDDHEGRTKRYFETLPVSVA